MKHTERIDAMAEVLRPLYHDEDTRRNTARWLLELGQVGLAELASAGGAQIEATISDSANRPADPLTDDRYAIEAAFVGGFLRASQEGSEHQQDAWVAMGRVTPEALKYPETRHLYELARAKLAAGEVIEPVTFVAEAMEQQTVESRQVMADVIADGPPGHLLLHGGEIMKGWRRRQFLELCSESSAYLQNGKAAKDGGRRLAERMALKLMSLYVDDADVGENSYPTFDSVLDEVGRRAQQEIGGVTLPWPKLERECGPWMPGEIVGVSAYSGAGKSSFGANLFFGLVQRGQPCIAFPTEMTFQWIERGIALTAGVSQRRAEKRFWKGADDERQRYLNAIEDARRLGEYAQIVVRPNISPAEIEIAVRVLRKRWAGRTVVVLVDHLHRLNYGEDEADKVVGVWTKRFKNLAMADKDGGLVMVLFYQPRKPGIGSSQYQPIEAHQIRGHSEVWNELDVHLSPFRPWVRTDSTLMTAWGTSKALVNSEGKVQFTKPEAEGAKVDDEHFFVKVDKRRIGGFGPTVMLDFDFPSGRIFEMEPQPRCDSLTRAAEGEAV